METKMRFFASYAAKDQAMADRLLEPLRTHLAASKRFAVTVWDFHRLLVGEQWHERILAELDRSNFGLLLLSPAFLTSQYIGEHELPRLVGNGERPVIPVCLRLVDLERQGMKGLEHYQLFRLNGRTFSQLTTAAQRERFVFELYRQIEDRVMSWLAPSGDPTS